MSSTTSSIQWQVPPNPSAPGTPAWTYDEIMRHIEPDLLTSALPSIDAYYAGESAIERHARFSSYQRAFAAFDAACRMLTERQRGELAPARRAAAEDAFGLDDVLASPVAP